MNLDEIKNRLDRLNNKGGGNSSNDYKNNFWRPPVGEKTQVRLVPYTHNKDFPFIEKECIEEGDDGCTEYKYHPRI